MILADENIEQRVITKLRESGIEVYSIYESARGISDEQVIKLSLDPPRIILTEDKDFGEWVFAHHIQTISVILLRYQWKDAALIADKLAQLILESGDGLFGKFTTLTTTKVRTRPLL
jgi:predicted nuclease of predicted toxin-antitoxin system